MPQISKIYKFYKEAIDKSYNKLQKKIQKASNDVRQCYFDFLKDFIVKIDKSEIKKLHLKDKINSYIGEEIKFVAIDGASFKEEFEEFVVFFSGAYSVRGTLKITKERVEYENWNINHDSGIVGYLPISYFDLKDDFLTDREKKEYKMLHNQLMQLAEIYLAYTYSNDIDLLLLDNSITSIYLSNDILDKLDEIKLVGREFRRNKITKGDIFISYAMPVNEVFGIPSCKNFRCEFFIIRNLYNNDYYQNRCWFLKETHITKLKRLNIITQNSDINHIYLNKKFANKISEAWDYMKDFFEFICEKIFIKRDVDTILTLSSNDIKVLISIGLRALIEKSWERGFFLVGIAKDSASRYFQNFLEVIHNKKCNVYAPDRLILEMLNYIENVGEFSTVEFDGVFSSLRKIDNEIVGVRGEVIVPQERLFLKSLAQFYVKDKENAGNVIFIDRVVNKYDEMHIDKNLKVKTKRDIVIPLVYHQKNLNQDILLYILDSLTKNLFPNVIGYPDPLHKADWGAKSMLKKIKEIIKSSEFKFNQNPLKRSLRDKRDKYGTF